jgi:hypothetical protein
VLVLKSTTVDQLREAFAWDRTPRYLLRDRGRTFGDDITKQVQNLGIQEVLSARGHLGKADT